MLFSYHTTAADFHPLLCKFFCFHFSLAKNAIPKCNITLITGQEMQDKVEKYLKVLCDANPNAVGGQMPDDGFYVK